MNALRCRRMRLLSAIFFAALLLVPLVERGHSHVDRDLAKPCAVCFVAHHSPAAAAPVVSFGVVCALAFVSLVLSVSAPARRTHSPASNRAPPDSFHIAVV
jgi:hypothetical protein